MPPAPHPFGLSNARAGAHAARSMMYLEMLALVRGLPVVAGRGDFQRIVIDENLLEKPTLTSRKKSFHLLTELYGLDPDKALFRVFWNLAHADPESLPQLCLVCAYARDPQLRSSFELIRALRLGELLDQAAMQRHLEAAFPDRFSAATKKSLARNVSTTWAFGGHLAGKVKKSRRLPEPRPVSAAYAMFAGFLTGLRGERLLSSPYTSLVASNRPQLLAALGLASARGLLSLKQAAGIVEFDFSNLLTPSEQEMLHESN